MLNIKQKTKQRMAPIIFLSPFIIIFVLFMAYPIIKSFILSFTKLQGGKTIFVGLKNFKYILTEPLFFKSIVNTFIILIIQVPIMTVLSMFLATLLNSQVVKLKGFFRLSIFMPVLIDLVTYSIIFSLFFNYENGFINNLLASIGIKPVQWLLKGGLAKATIIIALTWRWTGYNCIIMLAGLQNIPNDLYEAASIDGANSWTKFWKITVPELKPVILFSVILSIIGTLQLFTEPFLLTGGGPVNATETIVFYLYETAFKTYDFGLASAGSYILAIMIAILSYLQIKVTRGED